MQEIKVEADICINYLSDVSEPVGFAAGYEVTEITSGLIQGFRFHIVAQFLLWYIRKVAYTEELTCSRADYASYYKYK